MIDLGAVSRGVMVRLRHLADVLVLPSAFDSFGLLFLDAWARGTPVLRAARRATPAIIADAALTCEYGDVADLARALEAILANPVMARAMARRGRAKVESRYTWAAIAATV